MEALARACARRPVAMVVLAVAIAALGAIAWRVLPLDLLPDIQSPTVVISVRSGDRPPTEMERIYGERVEQQLFTVRKIRAIEQVARTGRMVATVTFEWGADMDLALVDVERAVGRLRSDPEVDEIVVRRFDPRQAPILSVGLIAPGGRPDLAELRRVARRQVAIALERLEGVAEVRVVGGRDREIRIDTDRARLEAYGVSLAELRERVRAANADVEAGTLEEGGGVLLVRGVSRFRGPADVENVVVRYARDAAGRNVAVRVSDLGRVSEVDAEYRHLVRVDGVEGVGLSVYKESGANTVGVSRAVREALGRVGADLPGIEVRTVSDEAAPIEEALADVEQAALLGIALAILVLVVFLRTPAPTVVVAAAVPTSLLATLFLMHLAGLSLNVMTLGGLALGAGMLVDNAIVVVESIFRRLQVGDAPEDAAARGTAEVMGAISSSTLTTVAVFLPVVFVQGLAARLVSGLAFTVVVSLLVSLLVAAMLVPALAVWLLPRKPVRLLDPGAAAVERMVLRLVRRPWATIAVATVLAAAAIVALSSLGTELLPPADPRQFSVRLVGPAGQRVEATERAIAVVEDVVREAGGDGVRATLSEVGRLPDDDRFVREEQTEENTARMFVALAEGSTPASVVAERAAAAVSGMRGVEASWEVGGSALAAALGTAGPPIVVDAYGRALDDLRETADRLTRALRERPELWNVVSSFEGGPPELRVILDRAVADGLGIDLATVAATLRASLDGLDVTTVSLGDEEREVRIRLPEVRSETLAALPIRGADGALVALGEIARLVPEEGAREVYRKDQRRVARVTARIAPGREFPAAVAAAREVTAALDLPAGVSARLSGEESERARTFTELGWAGAFALLLVFMVLAGTFESLIHPLTVATAVPLALIGVAVALLPAGRPIGVLESLGLLVLSGIAVNDAILLVDAARRRIAAGSPRAEALAAAAGERLRPILMTTLTTMLALVPLAFGTGEGARLRSPLAMTLLGGLATSTVASLTVVPCVYVVLDRLRRTRP